MYNSLSKWNIIPEDVRVELPTQLAPAMSVPTDANAPPAAGQVSLTLQPPSALSEKPVTPSASTNKELESAASIAGSLHLPTTSPFAAPGSNYFQRKGFPFSATNTKKGVLTETPPNTEQPLLNKFILYESKAKCYVPGRTRCRTQWHHVHRTADEWSDQDA